MSYRLKVFSASIISFFIIFVLIAAIIAGKTITEKVMERNNIEALNIPY